MVKSVVCESCFDAREATLPAVVKSGTIPELVLLFARGELDLIAKERGLTQQEVKKAIRLIANYLTVAKRKDSLKYGLLPLIERLEALKPAAYGTSQEEELLAEIASRLEAKPQMAPEKEPAVSGFEYFNRLLVRGEQWEKIQELQQFFKDAIEKKNGAALHFVQKIEMAFGKTFLMTPIYALLQAQKDRLVMGIFLKEQIQDVSKELGATLGNFAQKIQLLEFDRSTEFTVKRLENILTTLTEIKQERHFLSMTPQSVRSFYLKFIETWDLYSAALEKGEAVEDYEQKISIMQQILDLWEKADIIMDEEDLIQNPKQRLSFAIGGQDELPKERLGIIVEVYRVLTSESMQKKLNVALDFLNGSDKTDKIAFTQSYYDEVIKHKLVEELVDRLSGKVQNLHETLPFVKRFPDLANIMKTWSEDEWKLVSDFLLDQKEKEKEKGKLVSEIPLNTNSTEAGYQFISNLANENLRQVLSLLKGQLNELLPLALSRNYAERYGFHYPNDLLAGPFSGSNSPSFRSMFSKVWETADFTIQAHFQRKDYRQLTSEIVSTAREQALKEKMVKGCPLDETETFIRFANTIGKRSGVGLFQDNALEKLADYVAHDRSLQLDLIEDFILSEIKESKTELTATSQAFSLIFGVTKGFSGTPWNWQTFPKGTVVSAIAGTDGAVLVPLYQKSGNRIFEVSTKQDNRVTSLFNDNPSFRDAQAFIDTAGILRGIPHKEVGRQLFTIDWFRDAFDGVIFFDEQENKKIFEKATNSIVSPENSHIPMSRRFTFFDQKHTTGTNIKQMPQAKGVTAVGKQDTLRNKMQAAKRLRELDKGQQLDTVVHEDDAVVMKKALNLPQEKTLGFDDVITYLWQQQLERMGEENLVSAPHKMEAQAQRPILQLMKDGKQNPREVAKLFSKTRKLFFKDMHDDPFTQYAKKKVSKPKDEVMTMKIEAVLKPEVVDAYLNDKLLQPLGLSSLPKLQEWIGSAVNYNHLDDMLLTTNSEQEAEVEMEQQVEQENQTETEQQTEQQTEEDKWVTSPDRRAFYHDSDGVRYIISLVGNPGRPIYLENTVGRSELWDDNPEIKEISRKIFSDKLQISVNQARHYSHEDRAYKPVDYALIGISKVNNQYEYQAAMIDANDAADAEKALLEWEKREFPNKGWALYAMGVGQVQQVGLKIPGEPGHEDPALLSLLVQAKFIDGEIYYNEDEQKVLKEWIKQVGVEPVEKMILHIIRDQPLRRDAYPTSSLGTIIKHLKEGQP